MTQKISIFPTSPWVWPQPTVDCRRACLQSLFWSTDELDFCSHVLSSTHSFRPEDVFLTVCQWNLTVYHFLQQPVLSRKHLSWQDFWTTLLSKLRIVTRGSPAHMQVSGDRGDTEKKRKRKKRKVLKISNIISVIGSAVKKTNKNKIHTFILNESITP